jgi:cytochrome c oxidase subunit 2
VVPGITTSYRATPDRLGTFPVVCNLLCGLGHSLMRTTVHVVTPAQFAAWLKSRQGSTTASAGAAGAAASGGTTAGASG